MWIKRHFVQVFCRLLNYRHCEPDFIKGSVKIYLSITHLFKNIIKWRCFHADCIIIMNTCLHESDSFIPQPGLCVRLCVWWWMASEGANAWMCACSCVHATSSSHVSQQMLPEASAVSPVMCCPLTFSNIWGCCSLLVKDSTLLWLIMTLRLALICLNSRSAIWHLHDISIYVLASRLTLHCVELVGMTPVR